jgi:hypothetical protein
MGWIQQPPLRMPAKYSEKANDTLVKVEQGNREIYISCSIKYFQWNGNNSQKQKSIRRKKIYGSHVVFHRGDNENVISKDNLARATPEDAEPAQKL